MPSWSSALLLLAASATALHAQREPRIPLVTGLTLVSALHYPEGDREDIVVVSEASSEGARYTWRLQQSEKGSTGEPHRAEFQRFVRASDLASAPRLDQVFLSSGPVESPGYTAFSISRAVYHRVQTEKQVPFTITSVQGAGSIGAMVHVGGMFTTRVTLRGTLSLASPRPEPMPMLLNGNRVTIPTLRLVGHFSYQGKSGDTQMWVVADSTHPLVVRVVNGNDVLQTIRIDVPTSDSGIERAITTGCRAELPGLYFAFNSATLDQASDPALATIAKVVQRHGDWNVVIEGHTDSIGGGASNQQLSTRRAEAVRSALTGRYAIPPARLRAVGFGATRPRESNTTLEGRARNRRVELVRPCAGDK
jgi:outer membrane protein OmpA-like peptidoglycan-associated protein